MGVIIHSCNLNISPKMSYGVLECDMVMLQNYMRMICNKRFCHKNRGAICARSCIFYSVPITEESQAQFAFILKRLSTHLLSSQ